MQTPEYHISIERLDTEQKVFVGVVNGPITPLLRTTILEHAETIDAGRRLSRKQLRKAYQYGR
ncbi:MAG: hypothetical protein SXU28_01340 [Pseudomonadota bacterium]|nr:hypothetical protein [Pseudomonadota bacterium]